MEQTTAPETGESNDFPKPLVLAAPLLHAAMLPSWAPSCIRCFNPGILSNEELAAQPERYFTPDALPLSLPQARAQLQDLLAYASMHNKPGELSSLAAGGAQTPFASSSLDFREEFIDIAKISGKVLPPDKTAPREKDATPDPGLVQAQLTLLLVWAQEERLLELGRLSKKLADGWGNFDQALGLDISQEETDMAELGAGVSVRSSAPDNGLVSELLPWRLVLQHLLRFVPAGTWLVFFDAGLLQELEETGLNFEQPRPEETAFLLPEGAEPGVLARTTGAALLGKKSDVDAPWLENELHVLFPAAG